MIFLAQSKLKDLKMQTGVIIIPKVLLFKQQIQLTNRQLHFVDKKMKPVLNQ